MFPAVVEGDAMPLTVEELGRLGAEKHKSGGLVIETLKFRAIFLLNPDVDDHTHGSWHMRVEPKPSRDGAVTVVVGSVGEVLRGLYYAGRVIGQEDIRGKFRALMDVASSDDSGDGGLVGGEEETK